mgnify:FL=1
MIKKIDRISDFGIYKTFAWDTGKVKEFNERNLIYGWNYSGKTTLSRIFSSIKNKKIHRSYTSGKFSITTDTGTYDENDIESIPSNIEIFNSEYINENLKWDKNEELNAILFDVGSNIDIRSQIERNEQQIQKIEGNKTTIGRKKSYYDIIEEYEEFENYKFRDKASEIKNDILNSLIEFNKGHLKRVRDEVLEDLDSNIFSTDNYVNELKKIAISHNNKSTLNPINYSYNIEDLLKKVVTLLSSQPNKSTIIDILENDTKLYAWAKNGLDLHQDKKLETCSFCGTPFKENTLEKLNAYFTNEASELRNQIDNYNSILTDSSIAFQNILHGYSKNDFADSKVAKFEKLFDEYKVLQDRYSLLIDNLINDLSNKIESNIFNSISTTYSDDTLIADFDFWLTKTNKLIIENNDLINNFQSNQNDAREKIKKHYVAKFLKEESYLLKREKSQYAENCIKRYDCYIKKLQLKNNEFSAQLKSVIAGKEELNKFIKIFLSRDDIKIEVTTNDKFILNRNGRYAENLSEGEKTAISFAYFLAQLESLHRENKLVDTIIYIDDPISSLDSNHIAQVYSLINSFFFRKELDMSDPERYVNCFKQLFISTHNFNFFSFLRDSNRINKKNKCCYYYLKRVSSNNTTIEDLPNILKQKSEYIYLFSLLHNFHDTGCDINDEKYILIPNALRRFLEIYTLMKLPDSTGEVDSRLLILYGEGSNIKLLHHFSHFTSIEKIAKHDELILNLPAAVNELFTLLEQDRTHLESLKRAIGVTINN